jgi:hypothetical protein
MPKLPKDAVPEVKVDAGAAAVEASLSPEQRRGLFEAPGSTVYAIVAFTSKSYTGHADDEDKDPQVKIRVTECEVARTDEEAASLAEAKRAMWRSRRIDGTLDEVGNGPRGAAGVLDAAFAGHPSEDEYREHERAKRTRDLHNAPR